MMNTQADASRNAAGPQVHRLASTQALHLGRLGGELTVMTGRVWLTRKDDLGDHVFEAGQRVRLGLAEDAVIEAWNAGEGATVRWNPRHQSFVGAVLAEPLRGLAFLAGRLAGGCAALARRAAMSAEWAQGRIGQGDRFASSRH